MRKPIILLFILSEIGLLFGFIFYFIRDVYLVISGTVIEVPNVISAALFGMYYPSAVGSLDNIHNAYTEHIAGLVFYFILLAGLLYLSGKVLRFRVGVYCVLSRFCLLVSGVSFIYFEQAGTYSGLELFSSMLFIFGFLFFACSLLNLWRVNRKAQYLKLAETKHQNTEV